MLFTTPKISISPFMDCNVERKKFHHVKLLCIYVEHQAQICGQLITKLKFHEAQYRKCTHLLSTNVKNHHNCHLHQLHIFRWFRNNSGIRSHMSPHPICRVSKLWCMKCTMVIGFHSNHKIGNLLIKKWWIQQWLELLF